MANLSLASSTSTWGNISFYDDTTESAYFGADTGSTKWEFDTLNTDDQESPVAIVDGAMTLLIAHITSDSISMWIDPANTSSIANLGTADKSITLDPITSNGTWNRMRIGSAPANTITVESMIAATTFAEAVPEPMTFDVFDKTDTNLVLVAAHRCGYMYNGSDIFLLENSIPAAQNSINLGVDILETDIYLTSDNIPVLMHDSSVDRTTDGSGAVSSFTLAEIKALRLLAPDGSASTETVPTLEELMLLAKGKILVNLDKVDINNTTIRDRVMDVLIATDTVDHAIFKGSASAAEVAAMRAAYPDYDIIYMPMLWDKGEAEMLGMLYNHAPPATELLFGSEPTGMLSSNSLAAAASGGTRIWLTSLWSSLCAGHHDAVALGGNPDGSWGWLIDNGASIIQTDHAAQLIDYLETRGLRGLLPALPPVASYHFDDGTLQGWTNTLTGGITESTLTHFAPQTNQGRGGGHSPDYSLLHSGSGSWLDGRDIAHDTLVVSSPEFQIDKAQEISFHLLGGMGSPEAAPTNLSTLNATSTTDGFMGVALRRVSDDAYLLHDRRNSTGQNSEWEKQGWSASEVANAIASDSTNESYRIDLIDQFHGVGWGWIIMDSIAVEDTPFNEWIHQTLGDTGPDRSAGDDADGDGYSNWEEFIIGSNPTLASSSFNFGFEPNGITLTFTGAIGRTYTAYVCTNLSGAVWDVLESGIISTVPVAVDDEEERQNAFYQIEIALP